MLPSELLIYRYNGEEVAPKKLVLNKSNLEMASELISLFRACKGLTRGELDEQLFVLEGEETDYRLKRGLAHILANNFSTFEAMSPLEPEKLRARVFAASASSPPNGVSSQAVLPRQALTSGERTCLPS
jgi:uncharacterized protein